MVRLGSLGIGVVVGFLWNPEIGTLVLLLPCDKPLFLADSPLPAKTPIKTSTKTKQFLSIV